MSREHVGQTDWIDSVLEPERLKWIFRALAIAGLVTALGGLASIAVYGLTSPAPLMGTLGFLTFSFSLSGALVFFRQPQFSAFFSLIGAAFAEVQLDAHGIPNSEVTYALVPLVWLLLFQHPTKLLDPKTRVVAVVGLVVSTVISLPLAVGLAVPDLFTALLVFSLCSGVILLTHRCIQVGLLVSPRTMIFAFCLAPTIVATILVNVSSIRLSVPVSVAINLVIGFAPLGCLVYEVLLARSTKQESIHGPVQ